MNLPRVIGFCGHRNAGKDECARILHRKYGYVVRGFSDPIYELLAILNPIIRVNDHDVTYTAEEYNTAVSVFGIDYVKRHSDDVRRYLRLLGTECGRDVHGQDCWLKIMDTRMRLDERTAIQGIRFPNEVSFLRAQPDSLLICVQNKREQPPDAGHISETAINPTTEADFTIRNDGTLLDLEAELEKVIDGYLFWRDYGAV
jgi:dephospho-CoA kinase